MSSINSIALNYIPGPIDLLDWFTMPLSSAGLMNAGVIYGRDTHHLEGKNYANMTNTYAYHYRDASKIVIMKGPKGYPWDVKNYDGLYVYDYQTESVWSDPKTYKRFTSPKLGVPICNRFVIGQTIVTPKFGYTLVKAANCVQTILPGIGQIAYQSSNVFNYNPGGNLGNNPCVLIHYYWNGLLQIDGSYLYTDREQLWLTPTYGWVTWTHAKWISGTYVIDSMVINNQLVAGGAPIPVLPCP